MTEETDEATKRAALWYASQTERINAVPALRERFGLSAVQACNAIRDSYSLRQGNRDTPRGN